LFTHLFIYSFIYSFTCLFIYSFICSLIYSYILSFIHSFIRSFTSLFSSFIHFFSLVHLLLPSFIHSFMNSFIDSGLFAGALDSVSAVGSNQPTNSKILDSTAPDRRCAGLGRRLHADNVCPRDPGIDHTRLQPLGGAIQHRVQAVHAQLSMLRSQRGEPAIPCPSRTGMRHLMQSTIFSLRRSFTILDCRNFVTL